MSATASEPAKRPPLLVGIRNVVRESGLRGGVARILAYAYRHVLWPRLPVADAVRYGGVRIARDRRWGDRLVPDHWKPDGFADTPGYESTLVAELRRHVADGDRVLVVGGGVGVTAVVAAECAGARGRVRCYEGAAEGVALVRAAAARNAVADRLTVEHAVVGRAVSVYGQAPEGSVVAPETLPACDVLELDCEGAEREILNSMVIRPRVVLVESHGLYDAPTPWVVERLADLGYRPAVVDVAEPRLREVCERYDVRVVVGVRADS